MPGDFTCRWGTPHGLKGEQPLCQVKSHVPIKTYASGQKPCPHVPTLSNANDFTRHWGNSW